jgi:hypothetical protein
MKLTTFSDPILLIERHRYESRKILRESCEGLTKEQRLVVENIYKHFTPLIEATLTAQQIEQLFGEVEKTASAGGNNKTALGKAAGAVGAAAKGGAEAVKKANEILNQAGGWLKNTTPVQNFDGKFNGLKSKVVDKLGGEDSKIVQQVEKLGKLAKDNPGKTAAVIGVLTVLAGLAAGPVGGMVAGQVLRGASELIQGADLSTALGKGAKTAALGATVGAVSDFMQDALGGSYVSTEGTFYVNGQEVSQEEYSQHMKSKGFADPMNPTADELENATGKQLPNNVKSQLGQQSEFPQLKSGGFADNVQQTSDAQRAAKGLMGSRLKGESVYRQARPLSEGQVYFLFNKVEQLNEGPLWDRLKDQGKKAAAATKAKAAEVGSNLTNKVTASKLNAAWKKEESPTDSNELAEFLKRQGISDDVIQQVYQTMNIEMPAGQQQEPEQDQQQDEPDQQPEQPQAQQQQVNAVPSVKLVIEKIKKLAPEDREELLQDLKQEMGTA